jgi:hypothetical protein
MCMGWGAAKSILVIITMQGIVILAAFQTEPSEAAESLPTGNRLSDKKAAGVRSGPSSPAFSAK